MEDPMKGCREEWKESWMWHSSSSLSFSLPFATFIFLLEFYGYWKNVVSVYIYSIHLYSSFRSFIQRFSRFYSQCFNLSFSRWSSSRIKVVWYKRRGRREQEEMKRMKERRYFFFSSRTSIRLYQRRRWRCRWYLELNMTREESSSWNK